MSDDAEVRPEGEAPPEATATDDDAQVAPVHRHAFVVFAAIIVVQAVLVVINADLPILRNSFMYARAAQHVASHGYDPVPVVASNTKSYGKPVGFSYLCAPLVSGFGPKVGTKLASLIGSTAFIVVAFFFFQSANHRFGLPPVALPLQLALLAGSPLVLYQAWSSYPDSLFSALLLLAFLLADRVADRGERSRRDIVLLGVVIWAAVMTKLYGLILGLACPLLIGLGWLGAVRTWRFEPEPDDEAARGDADDEAEERDEDDERSEPRWLAPFVVHPGPAWWAHASKLPWLIGVFAALGLAVLGAREGWNPLLDLGSRGSQQHSVGMAELTTGLSRISIASVAGVLAAWLVAAFVAFGVTLLALAVRSPGPRWPFRWWLFIAIYLCGLVPFGADIAYNMRYVLPLFPFLALAIARAVLSIPWRAVRVGLLSVHACVATVLVLHYNVQPAHGLLQPLDRAVLEPVLNRGWRLENLRMAQHLELASQLRTLNEELEPGALLYWASRYGQDATHAVIEEMGLREDLDVCYRSSPLRAGLAVGNQVYIAHDVFYPQTTAKEHRNLRERALATSLGHGIVKLEPYVTVVKRSSRTDPGTPQVFEAWIPERIAELEPRVDIEIDGQAIVTLEEPPYRASWTSRTPGRHEVSARVHGATFNFQSLPMEFFVGKSVVTRFVVDCRDDVEDSATQGLTADSSDLEMVEETYRGTQVIGLRFPDLPIPRGATIVDAFLQFSSYGRSDGPTELFVAAEATGDAAPFTTTSGPISRPSTRNRVVWKPPPWLNGAGGADQRTPDISVLIEEVIARPDWTHGQAMAFFIDGSGLRVARSCDSASVRHLPPVLSIEFEQPR